MSGKAFAHRRAAGKDDFFETHYSLTWQGAEVFGFDKSLKVLEPAAGGYAMVQALHMCGFNNIIATDKNPRNSVILKKDFLKDDFSPVPYIITNPPNSLAPAFVHRAKKLYTKGAAFFLRLNFLSGQARNDSQVYRELKYIYAFTRMPDMRSDVSPLRVDGKYRTAMHVYAWMIWEKGFTGEPVYRRINNSRYVLKKGD